MIVRRFRRAGLKKFLKFALGIFKNRNVAQRAERATEFAQDEFARGIESTVEKNRADNSLERVGQRGRALASAVQFLAAAENEMLAEGKHPAMYGQGAAVDKLGAGLGKRAFVEARKLFVKLARQHELQHGIAEKFQPLVVQDGSSQLMRHGRMRERQTKLVFVTEVVTEADLEGGEIGHGGERFLIDDLPFAIAVPSGGGAAIHES